MGFYKGKPWEGWKAGFRFKVPSFKFIFLFSHLSLSPFFLYSQARGIEIAGAGHHIFLDNPEEFLAVVRNFVLEIKE